MAKINYRVLEWGVGTQKYFSVSIEWWNVIISNVTRIEGHIHSLIPGRPGQKSFDLAKAGLLQ